jgi:hypothetical protein
VLLTVPSSTECPECRVGLAQYWRWDELCESGIVSCKNCGVLNALQRHSRNDGKCNHCSLPVLAFHSRKSYVSEIYHVSCFGRVSESLAERQRQYMLSKKPSIGTSIGRYVLITIIAPFIAYMAHGVFQLLLKGGPQNTSPEVAFFRAFVPTFMFLIIVSPLGVILIHALSYLLWQIRTANSHLPQ